jgi:hypothetical protein
MAKLKYAPELPVVNYAKREATLFLSSFRTAPMRVLAVPGEHPPRWIKMLRSQASGSKPIIAADSL